ncbi:MAG: Zinc import ATP-binding protein ZnuC [Alphaproteobacteria bacterium MarineAlpha11_Bin1]|nr:MAG: Zinc import ATP-binding protein ZnuC [Alphaproteobacteria bacterium MarineAlpha11_Bin1]|tara:strand:+ start:14486 stop:15220 length:735 start_codon:yes stop_codon:yes gene_type:complete
MPEDPFTTPEILISGTGISAKYGGRSVLHDIDIAVSRNEFVTLIGPNGSGKTTLVRMLLGLEKPATGVINTAANMRVGYSPQSLAIDPTLPLSVGRFLKLSGVSETIRLEEALNSVGAPAVLNQEVRLLSGGEQKRVMLARALLGDPDLLVLDEPTANLDIHGRTEFYKLIGTIRDEQACGILLVSHDLDLVMSSTDKVVCINGHVCCSGKPDAVSQNPAYLDLFGEAASRVAVYRHHHEHNHA